MDITEILMAGFYVVTIIMSLVVIPAIKNKIGAQNMDEFLRWVDIAVAAAEQLYDMADGSRKKRYVVDYLALKGYKVDTAELDMAIEAAVNRLHHELYSGGDTNA